METAITTDGAPLVMWNCEMLIREPSQTVVRRLVVQRQVAWRLMAQ